MLRPRTHKRTRLVGAALTVVAIHLVVLALLTRGSAAALAALAWVVMSPLALALFARGVRFTRTAVTATLGLLVTTPAVVTHLGRTIFNGPSATDFTGLAAMLAGFVLLGVALDCAFAGTRRRTKLLLGVPLCLVALQFWVMPVLLTGLVATNAPRGDGPSVATLRILGAEDVRFRASDGVPLSGWFVPGRTRAAVVVLHGSHGSRSSTTRYIRFLHDAGYSVLAYDARGHGGSGGRENAYGWRGDRDMAGAVAYLRSRSGIDPGRIGALGLSMGGEEALRAAAHQAGIRAVVADGAGSSTQGDIKLERGDGSPLFAAVTWLGMHTVAAFSRDSEPRPLAEVVRTIRRPVLLIASNRSGERRIDAIFQARIGPEARLWYVRDAGHTQALAAHPAQYRARVLAFLADALR